MTDYTPFLFLVIGLAIAAAVWLLTYGDRHEPPDEEQTLDTRGPDDR